MKTYAIPDEFKLGPVGLTVKNLDRSLLFYQDVIGFKVQRAGEGWVFLAADEGMPLLYLAENPNAVLGLSRLSGLYHFAVLYPERAQLGRVFQRLRESGYSMGGGSDHSVSEALYLDDPDGHGIELYWDRPRDAWQRVNGKLKITTDPLDWNGLLREAEASDERWSGLPKGAVIGHVHLHVRDLDAAEAFYRDVLGFELQSRYRNNASFLSAGGYHHHIGINIWETREENARLKDAVRMKFYTFCLPGGDEVKRLEGRLGSSGFDVERKSGVIFFEDPSENRVVTVGGESPDEILSLTD